MITGAVKADHERQPCDHYADLDRDATNRIVVSDGVDRRPILAGPRNQGRR